MTATATGALITGGVADFGVAGLAILGSVIGIVVALVAVRFGIKWMKRTAK
jgi:hypothetical protein